MENRHCAVITGDITGFTGLSDKQREELILGTSTLIKGWVRTETLAEIFRGDSYQILIEDIDKVFYRMIQLICWFKMKDPAKGSSPNLGSEKALGTRMSIGLGEWAYLGKSVLDSDGEAFHLSGRNFDKMDRGELIRISSSNEDLNKEFEIILMLMSIQIQKWTSAQAEIIFRILSDPSITQVNLAKSLGKFQPNIVSFLKSAKWKEIEKAIGYLSFRTQKWLI